jgi:hypothetical protein
MNDAPPSPPLPATDSEIRAALARNQAIAAARLAALAPALARLREMQRHIQLRAAETEAEAAADAVRPRPAMGGPKA